MNAWAGAQGSIYTFSFGTLLKTPRPYATAVNFLVTGLAPRVRINPWEPPGTFLGAGGQFALATTNVNLSTGVIGSAVIRLNMRALDALTQRPLFSFVDVLGGDSFLPPADYDLTAAALATDWGGIDGRSAATLAIDDVLAMTETDGATPPPTSSIKGIVRQIANNVLARAPGVHVTAVGLTDPDVMRFSVLSKLGGD